MRVVFYIMAAVTGLFFGFGLDARWQLAVLCALAGLCIALVMGMSSSFYVLLVSIGVAILFAVLALTHVGTVTAWTLPAAALMAVTWICSVLTDPEPLPALPPKAHSR